MTKLRILALAAVWMFLGTSVASAGLLGAMVSLSASSSEFTITPASPMPAVVGALVEYPAICVYVSVPCGLSISMDISDTAIDFVFSGATGAAGTFILDLSVPDRTILGISDPGNPDLVTGTFGVSGFLAHSIQFQGDDGANIDAGTTLSLHFDVSSENAAPEPGALALMALGLAGMGFARRRNAR